MILNNFFILNIFEICFKKFIQFKIYINDFKQFFLI